MGRIMYHCKCDACNKEIPLVNDENDIRLNGLTAVLCQSCFENILEFYSSWHCDLNKLIMLGKK